MKKYLFIIIIFILFAFSHCINVNAQTVNDTLVIDKSYTFYVATTYYDDLTNWTVGPENPIRRISDGTYVYCIQAHVKFLDNSHVLGYDDLNTQLSFTNLTREELIKIRRYAYYGYGYGNHTSLDWYAATQLLIWETTEKVAVPYPIAKDDYSLKRINKYDSMMTEIKNLVEHHEDTVSFNNQKVTLNAGETIRLTDTNNALSKFFEVPESNESVSFSIEGNDLVIQSHKGYEGEINLIPKDNNNPPLLYSGANQRCIGKGDPEYRNAKILLDVSTEFTFDKVYGSSNSGTYIPEENAVFELYNNETNELITTLITDEFGKASIFLNFGTYRLHQIQGKDGYKFVNDYVFTIDGTHAKEVVYLQNEIIKSDLVFTKTDVSTDVGLPNTLIEIYNSNTNNLVFSGRTDDKGNIVLKNIEYGEYYLIEKEAPKGYQINPEKMYFSVDEDGKIIKIKMKDYKIVEVPNTGLSNINVKVIINIILLVISLGLIIYEKRKDIF